MSTKAAGVTYQLDQQVGHLLRRAYQRASANLTAGMADSRLTPMQFAVLARLHEHRCLSQNELGRRVAMEPANIHGLVGRLVDRGLVVVEKAPEDRRLVRLRLSSEGQDLIESLFPVALAATVTTMAPLSVAEQETLLTLLRRIINADGRRQADGSGL